MLYLKIFINPKWCDSTPFNHGHNDNWESFKDKDELWNYALKIVKREQEKEVPTYSKIEGYSNNKKLWEMEVISDEIR